MEAAATEPQEDGACCLHLLCQGGTFGHPLFLGNVLVKKALAMSSLLSFMNGFLVKKLLTTSSLLVFVGGVLVKEALAGHCPMVLVLVLPQFIQGPLPVLVGGLLGSVTSGKNWPPTWRRREQPCGLLVFAQGATNPICWGSKDPVGSTQKRLRPFVLQPSRRIRGSGQGQMSPS